MMPVCEFDKMNTRIWPVLGLKFGSDSNTKIQVAISYG